MTQVVDGTLGISRPDREWPKRCSRCTVLIPEESVPLMLWDQSGKLMWVYCRRCEGRIMRLALQQKKPTQGGTA
jgi:RNase P subunit RPR2